jgi:hypothetical protein
MARLRLKSHQFVPEGNRQEGSIETNISELIPMKKNNSTVLKGGKGHINKTVRLQNQLNLMSKKKRKKRNDTTRARNIRKPVTHNTRKRLQQAKRPYIISPVPAQPPLPPFPPLPGQLSWVDFRVHGRMRVVLLRLRCSMTGMCDLQVSCRNVLAICKPPGTVLSL